MLPEWVFIMLRPRSLEGGDLAFLFPIFNFYATKDSLFHDHYDLTVKYIYYLGGFDLVVLIFLMVRFRDLRYHPAFAVLSICREVLLFTKTAIYVMYSWHFIVPSWRLFITALNSQWCFIPVVITFAVKNRIVAAFDNQLLTGQRCD